MSEERLYYDGPLTVRASDWLDDWWVIERVDHAHERGLRAIGRNAFALHCSERVSDADVEGTGEQMRAIARAILAGEGAHFRRCAASPEGDHYLLSSPRNSMQDGMVPKARAEELARLILETVPEIAIPEVSDAD